MGEPAEERSIRRRARCPVAVREDSRSTKGAPGPQTITVDVELHACQQAVFDSPARFRVAACGRRFGKTVLGAVECFIEAWDNPGATVWWVAPTTKQARLAKRQLLKMLPKSLYHINNTLGEFTLVNGSRICLLSAERYDNLRGEGVDFVVIDEAAFISEEAWTEALRPSLSDRGGRALFISTFKGENWFWKLHTQAGNPDQTDWDAFLYPTSSNPYIPPAELVAAKRSMPYSKYMQEYECSVTSYEGAIFDGELLLAAAERGKAQFERTVPKFVEAGLDWGWHVTALEVCHETSDDRITWVYEHVWEHVELNKRCDHIVRILKEMAVSVVYADAAGASENVTLAVAIAKAGLRCEVQPVPFNVYKSVGIDVRRYYLENQLEDISPRCGSLLTDSKRYHYDVSGEKPAKGDDHTVDAATAFYASREDLLQGIRDRARPDEGEAV